MRLRIGPVIAAVSVALLATGCSSFGANTTSKQQSSKGATINVMIASSGTAETNAVTKAADAWAKKYGDKVVITNASNIDQQLGQALAGGTPPDLFYLDTNSFAAYAKGGSLYDYGDQISNPDDFYPGLRQAFTYNGKFYCVPKDFSTLALEINTDMWQKAGLTAADYPTTWAQLQQDATKLTSGKVTGLVIDTNYVPLFMKQAGGWITNAAQTQMTATSAANLKGLQYAQSLLKSKAVKYSAQVGAGWGGEAFGEGKAAMTIEGNWIDGAMQSDYPSIKYTVVPLPAGPANADTLSFTNCWGIAEKSANHAADVSLVQALTQPQQEVEFAKEFGVMPSRQSAQSAYETAFPTQKAFIAGAATAQGPVSADGFTNLLNTFYSQLGTLATADPSKLLQSLQQNGEQALKNG
jgi:multiple sugar transport system substrate-binding protein